MADFKKAIDQLLKHEGGYVNDPEDSGGETFAGVSRRNNKNWDGWKIIDKYKETINPITEKALLNKTLFSDKELMNLVYSVYKKNYWDCFNLDLVPSYKIAYMIFDTCVNMGKTVAIKCIQEVLNVEINGKFTEELFNKLCKYKD